jgi:sarcosine oxidase subunit beta
MLPVVGPSMTTPGLLHAFGFSGHGFQLGPAVGAVLAELALDGRTATPIEAFSIDRFRRAGTSVQTIAATEHAEPQSP